MFEEKLLKAAVRNNGLIIQYTSNILLLCTQPYEECYKIL